MQGGHHRTVTIIGTLAALRIDLVGTTADFRRFRPPQPLPINHLLGENCGTQGRIGEVGLSRLAPLAPRRLRGHPGTKIGEHAIAHIFHDKAVEPRISVKYRPGDVGRARLLAKHTPNETYLGQSMAAATLAA